MTAPCCRLRSRLHIADALGTALGLSGIAIERTPSAEAHRAILRPVARLPELVHDRLHDEEPRRARYTRPLAAMEDASPPEFVLAGEVGAVLSLLNGAQPGIVG